MKKSKLAIAALAAAVMCTGALGLAACSKTPANAPSGTKPNGGTTTPPATTEYTVTFDANGGKIEGEDTKALTTVSGKIATLPTATRENYTFSKWTVTKDNPAADDEFGTTTTVTSNLTVYAQWTEVTDNNNDDDQNNNDGDQNAVNYVMVGTRKIELTAVDPKAAGTDYDFKADNVSLTADDTLEFYTDSAKIASMWVKAECIGVKQEGVNAGSVQVKFTDTYNIRLQKWNDTGDWTIEVRAQNNTDPIAGAPQGVAVTATGGFIIGTIAGSDVNTTDKGIALTKGTEPNNQNMVQYKVENIHLSANDTIKFKIDGQVVNVTLSQTLGPNDPTIRTDLTGGGTGDITVTNTGTWSFYLNVDNGYKLYWAYSAD